MQKISRQVFLKRSVYTGAFIATSAIANGFYKKALANNFDEWGDATPIFDKLVKANDTQVQAILQLNYQGSFARKIGYDFATLAASYCSPSSRYYRDHLLAEGLQKITTILLNAQSADGTVSIGNLESPPDTAFLLEPVCAGAWILEHNKDTVTDAIRDKIKLFITKAAEALRTGGVHTPNHRWVISAALARINELYPDKRYTDRINEWLDEGIYMDSDGHYPERSMVYSKVEDEAFMTMGRLLHQPELYAYVKKNLQLIYYYMEPNGDLVTTDSRRQDQYLNKDILSYYLLYRYMAIVDNNSNFAAIAAFIETMPAFEDDVLKRDLFHFIENPTLQKALPVKNALDVNYEKFFSTSQLVRIRRGNTTATIFGGVDWPLTIASGRSNSPNFFSYRKGKAILHYMRLSTSFFSTGYFYSDGIKKEGDKYILHRRIEVPYYQPLPKDKRNKAGDYKLSPSIDDRFWNKMDFENRPVSNVKTLDIRVELVEKEGAVFTTFYVDGMDAVNVTIELCFNEGGQLKGTTEMPGTKDNWLLESAEGVYEYGADRIAFGPGAVKSRNIYNLEGERYTTHFGTLRTKGMHVYLTGVTPFQQQLYFK